MSSNIKQFLSRLKEQEKLVTEEVNSVVSEVAKTAFEAVRSRPPEGTPVDTRWARAGWRIKTNTPDNGPTQDKGDVPQSESAAIASLEEFLQTKDFSKISWIYINNGVPYIHILNSSNSTSSQSPANFVELGIKRALKLLNRHRVIK